MALTVEALAAEVGTDANDSRLPTVVTTARQLVAVYVLSAAESVVVPAEIVEQAELLAAVELFNQRRAPNGVLNQINDANGPGVVRVSRDPMVTVRPLLRPWIGGITT